MKIQYKITIITITGMLGMFSLLGSIFLGYSILTGVFLMFIFFGVTAVLSILLFVRMEEPSPPPILTQPPPIPPPSWTSSEQQEKGMLEPQYTEASRACPHCGNLLEPNTNICPACGAVVE